MFKKFLLSFLMIISITIMTGCALFDNTVELPDLLFMDKDEIIVRLDEEGLEPYFFEDESVEKNRPHVFIRYMNHEVGEEVERGETIAVVISSGLEEEEEPEDAPRVPIDPDGAYNAYEDVALYLDTFNAPPSNYSENDLIVFDPDEHEAIPGGDRAYYALEVDAADNDAYIVYSDDGLIYYTLDAFDTFEQLFGNEEHPPLDEDATYTTTEDVALYIRTFGKLPPNYFIRYERDVNLYRNTYGYVPDFYDDHAYFNDLVGLREAYGEEAYFGYWHFSNHAGQLPSYTMFYIADTKIWGAGWSRGNDRFVFSPDEKIVYYTADHFNTYELLYGDARD